MKSQLKKYANVLRIGYFLLASVLMMGAMTAFWISTTLYNTENFTRIAETALNEESSRQAVASAIRKRALKDYPVVDTTLGVRLEGLLVRVLGTDTARTAIRETAEGLQIVLTTERREPVEYDLKVVKVAVQKGQELLPQIERLDIDTERIPDSIVVFDTEKLPNVHQYGVWAVWLGPGCALGALLMYGYWIKRGGRGNTIKRIGAVLLAVAFTSFVALLIGPLVKPSILATAADADSQTLLGNVYEGFITPFNSVAIRLGTVAIVIWVLLTTYSWVHKKYSVKASVKVTKR
jgi:hypothetical protein